MQEKIDIKEDKGQLNDESGKLGGKKVDETPKYDQVKKDESHPDKG
jgi:hypothetical protein